MKKAVLWISVFFLTACGGGGSSPPISQAAVVDSSPVVPDVSIIEKKTITQSIDGELVSRTYQLRYPENPTEDSYPVVFFFHGAGGNRTDWLQQNPSIANLIDTGEFIGIFSQGYQ